VEKVNTTQAEAAGGEEETKKLGAFLRTERERLNLSQEQIAQKMRLRRFVIEAIENEEWDRLPPPVFVRGFLRSYARTLELDEKQILELYRLTAPPEKDTLKPVAVARSSHRGRTLFFVGVMVVIVCVAYYWHVRSTMRERESTVAADRPVPVKTAEIPKLPVLAPPSDAGEKVQHAEAPEEAEPMTVQEKPGDSEEKAEEGVPQFVLPSTPLVSQPQLLVLQGKVKETTWVRIRVDGDEAKEYIFQPGATPEWKGRNDFEITIGNAGGIDLDFEGKRMENLGRSGQVIRMRLP
jgi:cytoskeleton protein RodZ